LVIYIDSSLFPMSHHLRVITKKKYRVNWGITKEYWCLMGGTHWVYKEN